ncbi:hypothetical protein PVK06_049612 [Gossypium arboreum]|uniref:Uncharacterized protein n=1 Tax=Gossypium arboreum TaxID=29729 RepID=A0ABR0MJJ6_GOSAR|nr:hypothetical protein PVK06_049612 [Gossypium arboreum]
MEKGGMRSSTENLTLEENFLGNNKCLSDEGVGTGLETGRSREDLLNMGLNSQVVPSEVCGHHKYVDQMAGALGENGLNLRSGSSPVESDERGNGSGDKCVEDEVVGFNFGEEFVQLSQNRRKNKFLNRNIRSMREIQIGVLSTKEKQKRDKK